VAALDAIEGLAQEADHQTRARTLPVGGGWLTLRHLAVPSTLMLGVGVVAVAAGGAFGLGAAPVVVGVGLIAAIPAAVAAVVGAAVSVSVGPAINPLQLGPMANAIAGAKAAGPPLLAVIGVLPVVAARAAVSDDHSALTGAGPAALVVLLVAFAVTVTVLLRDG
jgi:hypothetical protein